MTRIYVLREKDKTTKVVEWRVVTATVFPQEAREWVQGHGPRAKIHREFDALHLDIPEHIIQEWNC